MIINKPICVTGASGFIASYVIRELLDMVILCELQFAA